jgi:hypothetical protein
MRGRFRENDWPLSMKTAGRFQRSQLTAFNDHVQLHRQNAPVCPNSLSASAHERHVSSARRRQLRLQLQHGDPEIADVDGGGGVSKGCRRRSLAEALACLRLIITW